MNFHKIFAIAVGFSLTAAGAAWGAAVSKPAPAANANAAPVTKATYGGAPEALIFSGRSISTHHKSRMHHVKAKTDEPVDAPRAGDVAPRATD